ncbi:hypothetical protein WV31_20035 [Magnetospirillum sp. ME-1]|uniref:AAA family ATPase n=1 Tax=Magnetospirillum sp. ME-1 TaxID=1639348 RepID=UPI000A17C078|nr:AAA family ATPase [Magnetospirillum sp. ME-1]ARJ68266.1 hypothetical protein WV31_20035 [Magnetospirillum sp. ME-1]
MFSTLRIENFTAFVDTSFTFVPGINVFVGGNGTGKTHILKMLYCMQYCTHKDSDTKTSISKKFVAVFRPYKGSLGRLVHRRAGKSIAQIKATSNNKHISLKFSNSAKPLQSTGGLGKFGQPVYIPVKELLSQAPQYRSIYNRYDLPHEEVYYDIIDLAYLPSLKGPAIEDRKKLLEFIRKIVDGRVTTKDEDFFLTNSSGDLEMTLVAEGTRKLALIWKLIQNGSLLSGSTLYWDEPEANLNPSMMQHVAGILTELARIGIQVFVATHSYAFLKEIEFHAMKSVPIRFFSLHRKPDEDGIFSHPSDSYEQISPNLIADEYIRIYDEGIRRSLGGL